MTPEIRKTLAEHFKVEKSNAEHLERKRLKLEEDEPLPEYQHAEYPKWAYHATEPAVTVQTPEHFDALGDGWSDKPVMADAKAAKKTK